ncbi:hypothetical protein BDB01DRAFT_896341 [Pilobolus umbonatus]|nr:hypothetical protein BDB01DRAFT_896341 [Pilobolus umbonatus]
MNTQYGPVSIISLGQIVYVLSIRVFFYFKRVDSSQKYLCTLHFPEFHLRDTILCNSTDGITTERSKKQLFPLIENPSNTLMESTDITSRVVFSTWDFCAGEGFWGCLLCKQQGVMFIRCLYQGKRHTRPKKFMTSTNMAQFNFLCASTRNYIVCHPYILVSQLQGELKSIVQSGDVKELTTRSSSLGVYIIDSPKRMTNRTDNNGNDPMRKIVYLRTVKSLG